MLKSSVGSKHGSPGHKEPVTEIVGRGHEHKKKRNRQFKTNIPDC